MAGHPISFRLTAEALAALKWAEEHMGLKRSAAVELALRRLRADHERPLRPTPEPRADGRGSS